MSLNRLTEAFERAIHGWLRGASDGEITGLLRLIQDEVKTRGKRLQDYLAEETRE